MSTLRLFVCIALLLLAAAAHADDFPIKEFHSFTWVVDAEPFWSPDGKQIVLVSSRHGGKKVHVLDVASANHGSDMRQLTTGSAEDDSPAWSPDGQWIVFVSIREGVSQVCVIHYDGSGEGQPVISTPIYNHQRHLTNAASEFVNPRWSPNGTKIMCARRHGDMNVIIFPAPK